MAYLITISNKNLYNTGFLLTHFFVLRVVEDLPIVQFRFFHTLAWCRKDWSVYWVAWPVASVAVALDHSRDCVIFLGTENIRHPAKVIVLSYFDMNTYIRSVSKNLHGAHLLGHTYVSRHAGRTLLWIVCLSTSY